tara:strand:+ start:419 stop:610 length:192 start_codon:yes stop_codon:yes gene_type:complete
MTEEETPKHNPQRKVWEDAGMFDTYNEAKLATIKYSTETKIRRCGPNGTKFKIKRLVRTLEEK